MAIDDFMNRDCIRLQKIGTFWPTLPFAVLISVRFPWACTSKSLSSHPCRGTHSNVLNMSKDESEREGCFRLCAGEEDSDSRAALAAPLELFAKHLPTKLDVAAFRRSAPLNNVAACTSLETDPFHLMLYNPRVANAASCVKKFSNCVAGIDKRTIGRVRCIQSDGVSWLHPTQEVKNVSHQYAYEARCHRRSFKIYFPVL